MMQLSPSVLFWNVEWTFWNNKDRAAYSGVVRCMDAWSRCRSVTVRVEANVISITKGFVQWAQQQQQQQLLAPIKGTVHVAAHSWFLQSWKSATRWLRAEVNVPFFFSPCFFFMVHYSTQHLILPIIETIFWLIDAKFHSSLITVMRFAFYRNVSMWLMLLYICALEAHIMCSLWRQIPPLGTIKSIHLSYSANTWYNSIKILINWQTLLFDGHALLMEDCSSHECIRK